MNFKKVMRTIQRSWTYVILILPFMAFFMIKEGFRLRKEAS